MESIKTHTLFSLFALILVVGCSTAQLRNKQRMSLEEQLKAMHLIQQSHVNSNIPPSEYFHNYLRRDLTSYFSKQFNKTIFVDYKILRNKPTQIGIGWPKYYLWAEIKDSGTIVSEGAVQVAAMDKVKFEVFQFIAAEEINKSSKKLNRYFPSVLHDEIRQFSNLDQE